MKSFAPVILYVYNRPYQTIKAIEYLKKNYLAKKSDLIVFSDEYKKNNLLDKKKVEIVRHIVKNISGFKSKKIILRKKNLGLVKNTISGLDFVFKKYNILTKIEHQQI